MLERPGALRLTETGPPPPPGPGEALVRVRRIGVCGTDLHAFRGKQPFFTYPRILGHELGVDVVEVSENDLGLKPGDRAAVEPYLNCGHCLACRRGKTNCCVSLEVLGVHRDGGMRERIIVPVHKLHTSDMLSFEQLALVEMLGIGCHAVSRAQLEPGERVLVIGAGPIGLSVIQFALLERGRVTVMDISEARLDFCRTHFRLDASANASDDPVASLASVLGGELPTVVFDATGSSASMTKAFELVSSGGKLVFVGLVQDDITFHDPEFHRRELTLYASRNATGGDFRRIIGLLEAKAFDVVPWITHTLPFKETADAFPGLLEPGGGIVKAMIEL